MSPQIPDLIKAQFVAQVYDAIDGGRPLSVAEIDTFYRDTDAVRSDLSARGQLARLVRNNARSGRNGHFLFVGARGAGKSTELNHLQKDLDGQIAVLNYSVMQELDPQSINYIELFIVTMEKLFAFAADKQLTLSKELLTSITHWIRSKEIEEIKDKHFSVETETGVETEASIPFLLKFFFRLKGAAKASKSFKETLKGTIEPRLSDLINHCNNLISEVRVQARAGLGLSDVVIMIEDLDKIPLQAAENLFFNNANQLVQLKANVIYTYPVALYYHTNFITIKNYFSDVVELPMIKVIGKDGQPYEAGIATMIDVVGARIDETLFANGSILRSMILSSGGVLRDLFNMINDAAFAADDRQKNVMDTTEFEYAYNQLKKEYSNTIAEFTLDGKTITPEDQYKALKGLVDSADKKPDNTAVMLQLRRNLCVLSYNGEGWCDVHPVMKAILLEKGY